MGIFTLSFPERLLTEFSKEIKIDNFIETGTYLGEGARLAAKLVDNVYTIELSQKYYEIAKSKEVKNIKYCLGSSLSVLPGIIKSLNGFSVFWLDAHYSGGDTAGEDFKCPLLKEIELINSLGLKCIIIIDDARFYLSPVTKEDKYMIDYPRMDKVFEALERVQGRYITVFGDIIVAGPTRIKPIIEEYCYGFYKRTGKDIEKKLQSIKKIPKIFRKIYKLD